MAQKQETARQAYIGALSHVAEKVSAFHKQDMRIVSELIDGKYLDGMPLIDEQGLVRDVSVRGITVEGRLFLQRLKAEEKAESFIGRLRKPGSFIAGTVFGALATMIPDLVKLWFFPK